MPRKKEPSQLISIDRNALDDAIFNGVQAMIDDAKIPASHRQKLRLADHITSGVMELVDAESVSVARPKRQKKTNSAKPPPIPDSGIEPAPHRL
jgi:hypothetical protein